jgi:hypothetical protein
MHKTLFCLASSNLLPGPLAPFSRGLVGFVARNAVLRLGGALLFLFGADSLAAANPKWEPVSEAELAEEKPLIEPSAGVEILNYQLDIEEREGHDRTITRRTRFKIYDPSRATEATRIATPGDHYFDEDFEITARLTLPDGTVREFGKSDFRTRSIAKAGRANGALGFLLSSSTWEDEEKFLAIAGVAKGSVLDIWEKEPDLSQIPWDVTPIQRKEIPIRRFAYKNRFKYDSEFKHRFYVLNPSGGTMSHNEEAGVIEFHAENLGSLPNEAMAVPATYYSLTIIQAYEQIKTGLQSRHTFLVPLPDDIHAGLGPWTALSTTTDFYDTDLGFVSKRVKQKAAELTAGAANEREKAHRIYNFVQTLYQRVRTRADLENWYTRYIESVDELIDLDQIDSTIIRIKDFYYLFIALNRGAGLECHTSLHPVRTNFRFTPDIIAKSFLNYRAVSVKVDGQWEICEPCSTLPLAFGQRPWEIENQPALLALPQQQTFLFVPSAPSENSVAETKADVELDTNGNIKGECVRTFTGHEAEVLRERLNATGREHWWTLARSIFDLESSSAEARLISVEGQDTPEQPLRVKAFIAWPAYASLMGGRMMIAPALFNEGQAPLLSASTRKTPVFFHYPVTKRDSITIQLPQGYRPGTLPQPIVSSSGDFSYALSMQFDSASGKLSVIRESVSRAVEIPVEKYSQAHDWFTRICAADQINISVRAGEPKK